VDPTLSSGFPKCERCRNPIAYGALVCDSCHTLVHSAQLKQLSADAQVLETSGDLAHARERWQSSLPLLPPDSQQAEWIRNRIVELDREMASSPIESQKKVDHPWARKFGPLAPILILLAKAKSFLAIFKFGSFFTLFASLWLYAKLYGAAFGLGFVILILIHEMGHYIDIRRRGLPADMPIFLPGLGAYVRWRALGVTLETRSEISLAGPLAGTIASAVCFAVYKQTGIPVWAALAHASAWLNLFNLIPVWMLDGGSAMNALNKLQRIVVLTTNLMLWYATQEITFVLVAAGCTYRLFTKDEPGEGSMKATIYFVLVLFALALLLRSIPKQVVTY
jgi:Zn-dependent protease